jgi:hypothetical protein
MAKKEKMSMPCCDDKYEMEEDARTLMRAHEVRKDKKRHKRAMDHMSKQAETHTQAAELEKKVATGLKEIFPENEA